MSVHQPEKYPESGQEADADVIIIGGGPSGLTLSILLGSQGVRVICLDREEVSKTLEKRFDTRTTAISYGSMKVMDRAGFWEELEPKGCRIEDIKITQNGSPTLLNFLAQDVNARAFGWIFENKDMREAMYGTIEKTPSITHEGGVCVTRIDFYDDLNSVTLQDGRTFYAPLVIGADGRGSFTREALKIGVRQWSYHQQAVICNVVHEKPHHNMALEDFRADGPFAMLPMNDNAQGAHRSGLVWTEDTRSRESLMQLSDEDFLAALNDRLPAEYGQATAIAGRAAYPLGLIHSHRYTGHRTALVADAAHGIHPIAGQGLNLGLRDVAEIGDRIIQAHKAKQDVGSVDLLSAYERARRPDNMLMAGVTDALVKLFSRRSKLLSPLRAFGLKMVERSHPAKRFFMRQAMGTAGLIPDMIKDEHKKAS